MKILMITPYLPYPLHSGGQIRSYNLIKNLSKDHEITLLSFMKQIVPEHVLELEKFCKNVHVIPRRKAFSLSNIALAGFSPYPFLVAIYFSLTFKKKIKEELLKNHYDLIHAETFYVMPNIPRTKVPILLVEQTIEYQVYAHFVHALKKFLIKPFLAVDVAKIKFWEIYYWKKADKVVAMSESDRMKMKSLVPDLSCEIVPNGIDTKLFRETKLKTNNSKTVVFVGNFSWLQNREAVSFLVDQVWPIIKKEVTDAKLLIVGKNPTPKILNLGQNKDISVKGKVVDIREVYNLANVLLAPIFGPGGTRFKILEAMSLGVPVVTTTTGIEGIPAQNETHVLVGNNPRELAISTIKILKDKTLSTRLSENAKELVQSEFSWEKISKQLSDLYAQVADVKN